VRRAFYLAVGVGIGVAAVRQLTKAANRAAGQLTPSGMAARAADSASGLMSSVRDFIDDVRAAMMQRETELRDALTGEPKTGRR
jgi:hypothetical protein